MRIYMYILEFEAQQKISQLALKLSIHEECILQPKNQRS